MKSYELKKKNGSLLPIESPFIIVTHHIDLYPKSNGRLAPSYYLENTKYSPWDSEHVCINIRNFMGFRCLNLIESTTL